MRNISIVTLITLFFALTVAVINIALGLEYKRQKSELHYFAFQRFIMSVKTMRDTSFEIIDERLEALHVKRSKEDVSALQERGEKLLEDPFFDMVHYQNKLYFVPKKSPHPPPPPPSSLGHKEHRPPPPHMSIVLEDMGEFSMVRLWILCAVINLLLVLFFVVVMRKLLRLKQLKNAIHLFGEHKVFEPIIIGSEDELGEIAHEFNGAIEKIHHLKEARTLFLRNILHELKTPIMKGKILSTGLEHEQLHRIFERLEALLTEMVKVEKLSSNEWILDTKEYRMVDVMDHARDLLMNDTERLHVKIEEEIPLVRVDFELFATALKNLLDNALKYSNEAVDVCISASSICVSSYGKKLDEKRLDFTKAFNRSIEGASSGLGLGLYIAYEIVKKHGFRLTYSYEDGRNCFSIYFA